MYTLIKLLILVFLVLNVKSQKVPVQIYYESLCEDSQTFVNQQLYPAYKSGLKDYVDIQWIPFGKSSFKTKGADIVFECHHGPMECYSNKIHSCAIKNIEVNSYQNIHTKESLTVEYLNCLMKSGKNFADNIYPGKRCAQELNMLTSWQQISECANSTEGNNLLKANGELTQQLDPKLSSVPLITFRHRQDPQIQKSAVTDFARAACNEILEPKPLVCAYSRAVIRSKFHKFVILFLVFITYIK